MKAGAKALTKGALCDAIAASTELKKSQCSKELDRHAHTCEQAKSPRDRRAPMSRPDLTRPPVPACKVRAQPPTCPAGPSHMHPLACGATTTAHDMALAGRFIAAAGRFLTGDKLFFISCKAMARSICVQTSGVLSFGSHLSPCR